MRRLRSPKVEDCVIVVCVLVVVPALLLIGSLVHAIFTAWGRSIGG